jgi:hypothetical protein
MLTGDDGETHDRILVDTDESARLSDTAALLQVLQDRHGLGVG